MSGRGTGQGYGGDGAALVHGMLALRFAEYGGEGPRTLAHGTPVGKKPAGRPGEGIVAGFGEAGAEAPCVASPDSFFEEGDAKATAAAKRACLACPSRERCLEDALMVGARDGVWGGMTGDERRALSARRQRQGIQRVAAGA